LIPLSEDFAALASESLFRAAIHYRNADVDILYMQFLSCNESMIHITKKFGMEVHSHYGEADAYLKLRPADPASASRYNPKLWMGGMREAAYPSA
jgi:hypothetical protein